MSLRCGERAAVGGRVARPASGAFADDPPTHGLGAVHPRSGAGEVDHRDPILNEAARRTHLLICCSRAKSAKLVLDL